ncbi:formyltetrahydrofolate-dependent phosphoribosylglycinamide formyltransferase [Caloranaerobacter azorensis DSM 13643]|uniref:Phosphoribosylglycinamide formyltransferase n=1 Tax=Caloranaerobacter azorensis DSM 13643 TaxID=1121264 RepID=A0A1M5V8L8_9FIRM|nr:phosphoribosylglycinamide formyltransferase [Caloranaerobacter azorensis]SHH71550.1 formyltetrahydrofolate-dependent phosphoribosylglycinamide formyltransferase [Caloranaerobacter azorensis DSM 13643]
MSSVNIGVLISGGGTNLQALIDSIDKGYINGKIKVVISNRKDAYGLVRARKNLIEALYINRKEFNSDIEFDLKILDELEKRQVELVVLAGYLKVLSKEFVNRYKNRIINIHPSLIPSFCGKGYYGEKVHRAVLDYGVKITGATVHFVDEGADTGPIILQEAVFVDNNDTVDTLREKVLEIEHKLLPMAVKLFCENKLEVIGRKVIIRD